MFRPDPRNPGGVIPASEVERRAEYLQEIGNDHPLMGLIHQCLSNMPAQRPEAPAILEQVNATLSTLPQPFTNRVEMFQQFEAHIQTLIDTNQSKQSENDRLTTETERKQSQIDSLRMQVERLSLRDPEEIERLTTETKRKRSEMDSLRVQVERLSLRDPSQQAHSQPSHTGQPDTQNQVRVLHNTSYIIH